MTTRVRVHLLLISMAALTVAMCVQPPQGPQWLAGDSHIHSHWSPGYDRSTTPPTPILGRDALYPTPVNAQMARRFGLAWMVTTDHGGRQSREAESDARRTTSSGNHDELVPDVLQFYGVELNLPGMDHHTLIIPRADFEAVGALNLEESLRRQSGRARRSRRNSVPAGELAALAVHGVAAADFRWCSRTTRPDRQPALEPSA